MAYAFDIFVLVVISTSPFFLPLIARVGPSYRIISGFTAILIGVFLIIAFGFSSLIDWEAHWLLANILEFISLALLPISLVLFAVAPFLYIGFGIRTLIKNRVVPIANQGSQTKRGMSRITKSLLFGIVVLLIGIYLAFNWLVSLGDRTMGAHREHMNAGDQAYHEHNYPEAEKHFLAALKAAEDFGFGDSPIKNNLLGTSLQRLAEVYEAQKQYEKAELLLKRDLAFAEQEFGPDHPMLVTPINRYAALLRKMNRESEALALQKRAKSIQPKHTGEIPNN